MIESLRRLASCTPWRNLARVGLGLGSHLMVGGTGPLLYLGNLVVERRSQEKNTWSAVERIQK